jgi:hypothetical protein
MPFKSNKQRAFLYKNKPEVAEKFSEHGESKKHEMSEHKSGMSAIKKRAGKK